MVAVSAPPIMVVPPSNCYRRLTSVFARTGFDHEPPAGKRISSSPPRRPGRTRRCWHSSGTQRIRMVSRQRTADNGGAAGVIAAAANVSSRCTGFTSEPLLESVFSRRLRPPLSTPLLLISPPLQRIRAWSAGAVSVPPVTWCRRSKCCRRLASARLCRFSPGEPLPERIFRSPADLKHAASRANSPGTQRIRMVSRQRTAGNSVPPL